jgi:hypothetical protein
MNDLPARLALLAAQGKTTTYGALAADLGCRVADLTAALERLMEEDATAHRALRAVVVNARHSDLPARGFFLKAAALGLVIDDPEAFVTAERKALLHP